MNTGIPIRQLSELTGVAATTLRAWERRYGLLSPQRTSKGHRLYSQDDIALVNAVVVQLQSGMSISEAVRRQRQPEKTQPQDAPVESSAKNQWLTFQRRLLHAIGRFDEARLDACYNEALSQYPFGLVSEALIIPTLTSLGEQWQQRPNGIAEEHFFTVYLRNKLGARLHHETSRKHGRRLLIACLPGELHEIGVLLFTIEALGHGYRILYLGANAPLAILSAVAQKIDAAAIVLSGTTVPLNAIETQWPELEKNHRPLFIGGQFSTQHAAWIKQHHATPLGSDTRKAIDTLLRISPPHQQATS